MLALLTSVGAGEAKAADASAAPETDHPVVDLRIWPTPDTNLSKLPDDEQGRMIRMGQALLTHTSAYLGPDATSESASMFHILSAFQFIYVNMPFGQASWKRPALSKDDAYDVAGFVVSHPRQPREGEVAKDFSNPYDKPPDFPWGPYVDSFSETQHKYGPYDRIRAEDAAANEKAKKEREAKASPASPPASK